MSFFGIMVFVVSLSILIISIHIVSFSDLNASLVSNMKAYENVANMETFTISSSGLISKTSNCTALYDQLSQIGNLDGIKAKLSGNDIVLSTYSSPKAVSAISCN